MDLSSIFNLPSHPHPTAAEQPFLSSISPVPATVIPSPPPQPHPAVVLKPQSNNSSPYAEMIFAAIKALNERDGSSKQAISRYISAAYPDLPPAHSALLDKAITNLKKRGHLVLNKKSYKIPGSEPIVPPVSLPESDRGTSGKRGRGRPKKQQPPKVDGGEVVGAAVLPVFSAADATLVSLGLVEEPTPAKMGSLLLKKGRGRPRKNALANGPAGAGSGKRGRPKKNVAAENGRTVDAAAGTAHVATGGVKRGRGRPKRIVEGNGEADATVQDLVVKQRGRGRPRVKSTGGTAVGYVGRKRGRPKKVDSGGEAGGAIVAVKRRGRPPGRKSSGRSVGRPRKNPQAGSSGAPTLGSFTEDDALRKFEYVQMKIKDALGTLRPQCTGSITAVDAIQELEAIASMDFTSVPAAAERPAAVTPAN